MGEAKQPRNEVCDDSETNMIDEVDAWADNHRRVVAMERCLKILACQQAEAVASLRKPDAQYTVPTCKDIADASQENNPHLEKCLHAAKTIYSDIEEETRAIMEVVSDSDVGRLYGHLWRRRAFWSNELEDVRIASNKAMESMQQVREDVAQVWAEIATTVGTRRNDTSKSSPSLTSLARNFSDLTEVKSAISFDDFVEETCDMPEKAYELKKALPGRFDWHFVNVFWGFSRDLVSLAQSSEEIQVK